jgi:hypothetical protein
MRHPDEVLIATEVVDGVPVEIWHHKSYNTDTTRGYRLLRTDTQADTEVAAPLNGGPAARRALAESFVRMETR